MDVDIFKDIIVPVIGGLGLFLLGLEFMEKGIQALSASKMRDLLGKMAGSPAKGVLAGTVITGIIQSSTAMTVMTVGLVNAGVLTLRGAIGVIMGANIGTTLGNGLIALPLGPIGLLFAGIFALVYVFGRGDKIKNIALASMGFSLIFYGINLMTGGLKPLKNMPAVMNVLSHLDSSSFVGVLGCALIAALVTAMIHSSSATIGIVMGLGASGILEWQTAIAFAIGADLGTTVTSWIASLNLSKNAKRTAYAHIIFNFVGVTVVLALFFPAIEVLKWAMGFMGGDPGRPVMADGKETFPLVPVAVGAFSIFFNIFNVMIMFPFAGLLERVLKRIGHSDAEDAEDYSVARYLRKEQQASYAEAMPALTSETRRLVEASAAFLGMARGAKNVPADPAEHYEATDTLSRQIREFTAPIFAQDLNREQMDRLASVVEEVDHTSAFNQTMEQVARRVRREEFSEAARGFVHRALDRLDHTVAMVVPEGGMSVARTDADDPSTTVVPDERAHPAAETFDELRWGVIDSADVQPGEKGAILALLGSIERAEHQMGRILTERASRDEAVVTHGATAVAAV